MRQIGKIAVNTVGQVDCKTRFDMHMVCVIDFPGRAYMYIHVLPQEYKNLIENTPLLRRNAIFRPPKLKAALDLYPPQNIVYVFFRRNQSRYLRGNIRHMNF